MRPAIDATPPLIKTIVYYYLAFYFYIYSEVPLLFLFILLNEWIALLFSSVVSFIIFAEIK